MGPPREPPGGAPERAPAHVALALALSAAAVALLAAAHVLEGAHTAFLFGDEFHSLREIQAGWRGLLTEFSTEGSGQLYPLLQHGLAEAFGLSHWSARLPAAAAGIALLLALAPLGSRLLGPGAGAAAGFLGAASSSLLFYAHFARAYAPALLACLGLLYAVQRLADGAPSTKGRLAAVAVLVGLLPALHLTALGFVAPVLLGGAIALGAARRGGALAGLVAASAVGGALALALHWPAWDSLVAALEEQERKTYTAPFGPLDVASVLAGSREGALGGALALSAGLGLLAARDRSRRLPLVLGCVGPPLALLAARPYGDAYAYARYALWLLPAGFLVTGAALRAAAGRLLGAPAPRELAAAGAGGVLALALALAGPLGPRGTPDGPYANTYLSLYPLPSWDVPFEETPAFYRRLAAAEEPVRILEAPALLTRSRHLYRNYYLQHRMPTRLAFYPQELSVTPEGPYRSVARLADRPVARSDYLVLHRRPVEELRSYWSFVYEVHERRSADPSARALMLRHQRVGGWLGRPPARLDERLEERYGPPVFRDAWISVYRLRDEAPRIGAAGTGLAARGDGEDP